MKKLLALISGVLILQGTVPDKPIVTYQTTTMTDQTTNQHVIVMVKKVSAL